LRAAGLHRAPRAHLRAGVAHPVARGAGRGPGAHRAARRARAPPTGGDDMSAPTNRRVLRRVTTAVSGAALLAAAAGVALAGQAVPVDVVAVDDVVVPVDAATVAQVCPGPPRLATAVAGEDLGYDEFDPEGSGTSTVLDVVTLARSEDQPPGALRLRPGLDAPAGEEVPLAGTARLAQRTDAGETTVLEAEPVEDVVALVAGTSVAVTE